MESSSSSPSQGSLLFSDWQKFWDPLSKKNYFYHTGSQTCQWTDPELGVIEQYPTPRASDLIGSERKKRIQDVLDRMDQRSWVGSSAMEIQRQKQQIAATFSISAFGLDVPDIVAQFADLVDILEREREAIMNRHFALANSIEGKLSFISSAALHPLVTREIVAEVVSEAWDAAHHLAKNMPPPPANAYAAIDVQSHLQSSRVAIDGPDLGHSSDTLTQVNSTQASISPPTQSNNEGGDSSLDPEVSALEILSDCSCTPKRARKIKKKRISQKHSVEKDPAKFKHKCSTCGDRFTRSTTLQEHARSHSGKRPFACSVCGADFPRSKDRNRHQKIHTGGEEYLCGIYTATRDYWGCGKSFARKDQLAAHFRTRGSSRCIAPMLQDQELRKHLMEKAGNGSGYCCQLGDNACRANFNNFGDLITHLEDKASRSCMADFLVKRAIVMNRVDRGMGADELRAFFASASKVKNRYTWRYTPNSSQDQSPVRGTTNLERHTDSASTAVDRSKFRCPFPKCVSEGTGFSSMDEYISYLINNHDDDPCPFSHCVVNLNSQSTAHHINSCHESFECALRSCKDTVSHFSAFGLLLHLEHDHKMEHELAKNAVAVAETKGNIIRDEDVLEEHEITDCFECLRFRTRQSG